MNVEENKALATRIIEGFINKNNPVIANEIFAEDFVNHSPQFGVTPDREGMIHMIALLHQGFPDIHLTIEDMVAENDKVVLQMRSTGKNTGEFLGIQPTNKSMDSCQISIIRIEEGKVKERWNITDQLEVLRQLGLM